MSAGEQHARRLIAGSETRELVFLMSLTDRLLDARGNGLTVEQDLSICTTRGWIIDELDGRGLLGLLDPAFA